MSNRVVVLSVCLWSRGKCADLPNGSFSLDCLDRNFRTTLDTAFTAGSELRFEAVDDSGAFYPITEQYAAECGYSISLLPHLGFVELRASYFSCHAVNQGDTTFTLTFNLMVAREGQEEETYALTKTCSPTLPWASREINCEVNYMELNMKNDAMRFPTGKKVIEWNSDVDAVYRLAQNDWQVQFQTGEQRATPMPLSAALDMGYTLNVTAGRLVFRTPYQQPDSTQALVAGVLVDTVHATIFSRRGRTLLAVDLHAACPMHSGFYNGSSLVWVNPLHAGGSSYDSRSQEIRLGVHGQLLEPAISMERGYGMETFDSVVHVIIPYNAEGGDRKSFVEENVYREYYVFQLYFEQWFIDENQVDTRLRQYRPLVSPLLSRPAFSLNQTVLAERMFTVYLGNFAADVALTAVRLNGILESPDRLSKNISISEVGHPNLTHGYTLRMPFDHLFVIMELSDEGILQYTLDINYTLSVGVGVSMESFYYHVTIVAMFKDVFPPVVEARCFENGISFTLDLGPFAFLWALYAGTWPLMDLMTKDSQNLVLNVPVFADGYVYENVGIKTFSGTFEVLIRDAKTLKVRGGAAKTCQFPTRELILCSPTGKVTLVAKVSMATPRGEGSYSVSLLDKACGAVEKDQSMALFVFEVNNCGTRVEFGNDVMVYENELVFTHRFLSAKRPQREAMDAPERVTVQCVYRLSGLYYHLLQHPHQLVSCLPGVGSIRHIKHAGQQETVPPSIEPTPAPRPTMSSAEAGADDRPLKYDKKVKVMKDMKVI